MHLLGRCPEPVLDHAGKRAALVFFVSLAIALALHLPFPRRELKCGTGENLPLGRSNTALEHGVLGLDVEVHYVAI